MLHAMAPTRPPVVKAVHRSSQSQHVPAAPTARVAKATKKRALTKKSTKKAPARHTSSTRLAQGAVEQSPAKPPASLLLYLEEYATSSTGTCLSTQSLTTSLVPMSIVAIIPKLIDEKYGLTPAILHACKAIHGEAIETLYHKNTFAIRILEDNEGQKEMVIWCPITRFKPKYRRNLWRSQTCKP
jgi:hypothetical protein